MGLRRTAGVLAVTAAAMVLAACGSSGTHPQSFTPDPTPTVSSPPSSSGTSSSAPPSPTLSIGVSKVPTPTVAPAAQAAVDAYIAFYNISNEIDANPAHADVAKMNQYLTGKALTLFDGVVTSQRTSGTAYRGIPPQPRVTVGTIFSPTFVVLASCPAQSRANPFVQIYVATGKPVPVSSPAIAPPYKITISMQKINGAWKVADLLVDTSKTCTG